MAASEADRPKGTTPGEMFVKALDEAAAAPTRQAEIDAITERTRRLVERVAGDADPLSTLRRPCGACDGTTWEEFVDESGIARARRCTSCSVGRVGDPAGTPTTAAGLTLASWARTGPRFADDDNREALHHAALFIERLHTGLYFWGGCGTGKSEIAAAILGTTWRTPGGDAGRFIRCTDLLQRLVGQFDDDTDRRDQASALFQELETVPVLVLDDLGAQKGSDYARRMLQELFDRRIDRRHRTIWTSNYQLDELVEQMGAGGDRLVSRIAGQCKVVKLDGKDWRLHAARTRDGRR